MADKIVVVGSTNVDFVMKMQRLPAVGETVTDASFLQAFGGKGANTAVAAARTGPALRTVFITALGDDVFAPVIVENFRRDKIDVTQIHLKRGLATGSALIMLDGEGRNYLSVAPGANYALGVDEIEKHAGVIRTATLVVMQMEIPAATVRRVMDMCIDAGVPVLFNYAPVKGAEVAVDAKMTGLVVNESEAAHLTGKEVHDAASAKVAAAELLARGPKFVVVTLGPAGALLKTADTEVQVPGYEIKAVDTTAAGDTFCGALAVALVEGKKLPAAVEFAVAASALTCTKLGAQQSIPTRYEVDGFMLGG